MFLKPLVCNNVPMSRRHDDDWDDFVAQSVLNSIRPELCRKIWKANTDELRIKQRKKTICINNRNTGAATCFFQKMTKGLSRTVIDRTAFGLYISSAGVNTLSKGATETMIWRLHTLMKMSSIIKNLCAPSSTSMLRVPPSPFLLKIFSVGNCLQVNFTQAVLFFHERPFFLHIYLYMKQDLW